MPRRADAARARTRALRAQLGAQRPGHQRRSAGSSRSSGREERHVGPREIRKQPSAARSPQDPVANRRREMLQHRDPAQRKPPLGFEGGEESRPGRSRATSAIAAARFERCEVSRAAGQPSVRTSAPHLVPARRSSGGLLISAAASEGAIARSAWCSSKTLRCAPQPPHGHPGLAARRERQLKTGADDRRWPSAHQRSGFRSVWTSSRTSTNGVLAVSSECIRGRARRRRRCRAGDQPHGVHRRRDGSEQLKRVVVVIVEGQPGERAGVLVRPLREERALAIRRARRQHERDLACAADVAAAGCAVRAGPAAAAAGGGPRAEQAGVPGPGRTRASARRRPSAAVDRLRVCLKLWPRSSRRTTAGMRPVQRGAASDRLGDRVALRR